MKFIINLAVETQDKAESAVRASIDAALAEVVRGVALTTITIDENKEVEAEVNSNLDGLGRDELEALAKSLSIRVTSKWKDATIVKKITEAKGG